MDPIATVLVVDDDPQILKIFDGLLSRKGYRVLGAQSAEEAESVLAAESIELLIMDVVMPGKGGIEYLMDLRRDRPLLPVIVMTGKVPIETGPLPMLVDQFRAKCVLPKPFTPERLMEAVEAALREACA